MGTQLEKGDSLTARYTSELWDFTRISVTQNDLRELKKRGPNGNPGYSCFTFGNVNLAPTVEEYTALLRCLRVQVDKAYSRATNVPTFVKKLMNIIGMNVKNRVDVFALSIYGLIIFLKALMHVEKAVSDLFDQLDKRVMPIPLILVETFRSLNACRRAGEGRFIGCTQLLLAWFHIHFWKEIVTTSIRDDISEERWIATLQNLQEEDIEWRAPWLVFNEILYRCGDFDWVPLLGIWDVVGYAHLLVLRQYRSRQFIPVTHGLARCEFSYKGDNYKKKVREMSNA
ncbi:hypothetical protein PVK06_020059 [Gossypium arboreum]|uniref:DUF7745 domain-containing protein n=1 Tax=Gossypium arboreum TaxID=29729 RepID=A0ABR0PLD4_GOSAR|nr:hypothetical protein PVK06_020059 [Gossypium arboreum]